MFNLYKKSLIILVILVLNVWTAIAACDKTMQWELRAWYSYNFFDEFINNTSTNIWIYDVDISYSEQYDYNNSTFFPNFSWTSWLTNNWGIIGSWITWPIVESDSAYLVGYNPPVRAYNNLSLTYLTTYYKQAWANWDGPFTHTVCKNYEITWCWDGIIDSDYSEVCDPNDVTHTAWWTSWCNSSCQPVNLPVIECWDGIINGTEICDYNDVTQTAWWTAWCSSICLPLNNPINGLCWIDDGWSFSTTPTNLCDIWTPSLVIDNWVLSTYNWTCLWLDGWLPDLCSANHIWVWICWDSVIQSPNSVWQFETCDDGNLLNWDGCDSTCQIEPVVINWLCWPDDGTTLSAFPTVNPLCNDWTATAVTWTWPWTWTCLWSWTWAIDDVCSVDSSLVLENWVCWTAAGVPTLIAPINDLCLVWSVTPFPVAGTGPWTWTCPWINGWADASCSAPLLWTPVCWNNVIEAPETCDDGNLLNWDWCSSICQIETPTTSSSSGWPGSPSSSGGWSSSSSSSSSGWPISSICWDGHVQRPNSNLFLEECDFGTLVNWWFCNRNCTYINSTFPAAWIWEITIPNGWKLVFWPKDNVIIWVWMNPYIAHSLWKPYIENLSDYDFYFDELCVIKKSWTKLLWSTVCKPAGILKSWETISFPITPNFVWAKITTWNYSDNRLVTTINHNWVVYDDAYFSAPLDVRVAKSSVATIWGWTSYIWKGSNISNISDIAEWVVDPNQNKNFIWVWISSGDSSYSNDITDTWSITSIEWEWSIYSDNLNQNSEVAWTALWDTTLLSKFENYNWISNVFILRNTNFIIDSNMFSLLNWARTYVIENWDLKINSNINYTDNIAFVVKWWNIIIDKTVSSINWTYITIIKDWIWWNFLWGGTTTDILVINWSLYWNINDLISTRTYVKQNSFNQIDVWTIVSFGSSLFRKSAPLLSTFINEYLQSDKIAK